MTFDCTLTVTGLDPKVSSEAFIDSYQKTSRMSYYKKYKNKLEQYFVNKVNRNIDQNQIKSTGLKDSFSIKFQGNSLEFISKHKKALKYEYGYGNTPPRRYIQPAVFETANELSNIIISEAISLYNKNSKFGQGMQVISTPILNLQSNYLNKYSKMLK